VLLLDERGTVLIHPVAGRVKSPGVERRSECMADKEECGPYRSKSATIKHPLPHIACTKHLN